MDGDEGSCTDRRHLHGSAAGPIPGMDSVVATVSGYLGTERFNLIKLISLAGANYVGGMSRSTTHLICSKFEGKKYELARRFKTVVVNHQWVEECIRQQKRVSEQPFMLKSGQEVVPLVMQVPQDFGVGIKKRKALSNRSNFCHDSITTGRVSVSEVVRVSEDSWTDSILVKQKQKGLIESSSKEKRNLSTTEASNLSSPCLAREGNYPRHSNGSSPFAESSQRRRLVKKNLIKWTPTIATSDSEDDCRVIEPRNTSYNKAASSSKLDTVDQLEKPATGITSDATPSDHQGNKNLSHVVVNETENCNHQSAARDFSVIGPPAAVDIALENVSNHVKHLTEEIIDKDQTVSAAKPPASSELSCVICWTDFSSTRGVLPCGHRFCFTCIRDWAKSTASRKRASTCPLCKTTFMSIRIVEDAACSDQKIYSQTIPHAHSVTDVYVLPDQYMPSSTVQLYTEPVCVECRSREPADLLISCDVCKILCIHSYCLDPPLVPWICMHCRDLRISHYWAG